MTLAVDILMERLRAEQKLLKAWQEDVETLNKQIAAAEEHVDNVQSRIDELEKDIKTLNGIN